MSLARDVFSGPMFNQRRLTSDVPCLTALGFNSPSGYGWLLLNESVRKLAGCKSHESGLNTGLAEGRSRCETKSSLSHHRLAASSSSSLLNEPDQPSVIPGFAWMNACSSA